MPERTVQLAIGLFRRNRNLSIVQESSRAYLGQDDGGLPAHSLDERRNVYSRRSPLAADSRARP
jgi:hypothetical protein